MKKKLMVLVTVIAMVLSLSACSSTSPSDVVKGELDVVKSASSESLIQEALESAQVDDPDLLEPVVAKLQDFEYEVVDEKIDGDTAVVTVEITTYEFGKLFKDAYDGLMKAAMAGELDTTDERAITERLYKPMTEASEKSYIKEVTVKCTKDGKDWVTDFDENEEFLDAVFGGLMSTMSSL